MQTQTDPTGRTLVDVLRDRAQRTPHRTALRFLEDGDEERSLDYAELDRRARAVAAALLDRGMRGERVLLLYPPGAGYVTGFLGCLYAGAVAVPQYLPTGKRGAEGVLATARDAGAALVLGDGPALGTIRAQYPAFAATSLDWLDADEAGLPAPDGEFPGPAPRDLAFLQYTSGSTGTPKGVMVRHDNLVHNSAAISRALGTHAGSEGVSWLPPYHDMGLIGGILQPLYAGFPCTLMAPMAFLRRPLRWLETMSRHRATVSAAPDFAYLECVRRGRDEDRAHLDLSAWEHALSGAEPVRPATLEAFAAAFAPNGFRRSAFHPCYGMAETTLFVTGGSPSGGEPRVRELDREALQLGEAREAARPPAAADRTAEPVRLTGCGTPRSEDLVVVVDTASGKPCPPGRVGEIWVSGPTVTAGYWRRPEQTEETFRARLADRPGRDFLRTGDLGFLLDGELFVTGRVKDLMIVRGRNHYPQDLEATAEAAHPLIQPTRSAAFSVERDGEEHVVLVHEAVRGFDTTRAQEVLDAVALAVGTGHGVAPHEVVLVRPGAVPRTTSGKIRRGACRELWLTGALAPLARSGRSAGPAAPADAPAPTWGDPAVAASIAAALDLPVAELPPDTPLVALGLDSLRAVRLAETLRRAHGVTVPLTGLLDGATPRTTAELAGEPPAEGTPAPGTGPAGTPPRGDGPPPVTRAQERMWLFDRMGAGGAYHIVGGVRMTGPVEHARLEAALTTLLERHEVLRTGFAAGPDGSPHATLRPPAPVRLPLVDVTGTAGPGERERRATEAVRDLGREPFDLADGPLLRAVLVHAGPDTWYVGLAVHHIAVDGWSLGILLRELGELYLGAGDSGPAPAGPAPADAAPDPAAEQYWASALAHADAVTLPADLPLPDHLWNGASLPLTLTPGTVTRLRALAAAHRATPYMVLLAGLTAVLARWTDQRDLVVGTPAARRHRPGTADRVGLFVNTLPLRVGAGGDPDFTALLDRVRAACLAAYPHQDVPLERVVELTGAADPAGPRAPLVRVCLALQNLPLEPWEARGVRAEPFELPPLGAQFELSVHLAERPDGSLDGYVLYAADLFEEATVRAVTDGFEALLDHALDTPGTPLSRLPLLASAAVERARAEGARQGRLVVDGGGRPVPAGVPGELWTADAASPTGYTATGTLARRAADGTVTELGRLDELVEIGGHRVSPAHVASLLTGHPAVASAGVDVGSDDRGPYLTAHLEPAGDARPRPADLRAFLSAWLPGGSVPAVWDWAGDGSAAEGAEPFVLEVLDVLGEERETVAPRDETERTLARIWCDVMGLPEVSVTDDFFELGGHSLQAARIAVRVQSAFGTELSLGDLLRTGLTIERLAARLREAAAPPGGAPAPGGAAAEDGTPPDADAEAALEATLDELEQLSDEEIADLLR
ncbi:condensation domain-containing protein [Streptomyces sp. enrichment culture]|uniref:condensation domain-containing protein n=1 Tax=Streptomyces sp. enrichment culture TaxID=1795815 RepID=UPI003F56ECA4